jgi:hypothetical protein
VSHTLAAALGLPAGWDATLTGDASPRVGIRCTRCGTGTAPHYDPVLDRATLRATATSHLCPKGAAA